MFIGLYLMKFLFNWLILVFKNLYCFIFNVFVDWLISGLMTSLMDIFVLFYVETIYFIM